MNYFLYIYKKIKMMNEIELIKSKFQLIEPEYLVYNGTEDNSVFFQAALKNKTIYLEYYFGDEPEAILNIYENKICILAYGGTIDDVFLKIWDCCFPKTSRC